MTTLAEYEEEIISLHNELKQLKIENLELKDCISEIYDLIEYLPYQSEQTKDILFLCRTLLRKELYEFR